MTLFVLVATAVYDQGVVGVYTSEELAKQAAEEIWPHTDGHHAFRIDQREIDKTYEFVFDHQFMDLERKPKGPVKFVHE